MNDRSSPDIVTYINDVEMRELLSAKDVGKGRSVLRRILALRATPTAMVQSDGLPNCRYPSCDLINCGDCGGPGHERHAAEPQKIAADAIRTFCRSLGAAAVQNYDGMERIYYSGIPLDALAAAVAMAQSAERCSAGSDGLREMLAAAWMYGHCRARGFTFAETDIPGCKGSFLWGQAMMDAVAIMPDAAQPPAQDQTS